MGGRWSRLRGCLEAPLTRGLTEAPAEHGAGGLSLEAPLWDPSSLAGQVAPETRLAPGCLRWGRAWLA